MTEHSPLSDPQEVIGREWSKDSSPERRKILGLARDALIFILSTGQKGRFEDFRLRPESGADEDPRERPISLKESLARTVEFFSQLRDENESAEERALIQVILDTLRFISSTSQEEAFRQYLENEEAHGPPHAVASFASLEEAKLWLDKHPYPPDAASVLVASRPYEVVYARTTDYRRLTPSRRLEHYLAELKTESPPVAIATFSTLEEAEAWLLSHPAPAPWAWVSVAGEFYLAAHYANLGHRALYPLSLANGYEQVRSHPNGLS
jgi:hypothetical protein